jgi:hypothetical protein
MFFCLPNIINPKYIQLLGEIVPPPSQYTVGVRNQIFLPIFSYISSKVETLIKDNDTPTQVPNIFYLTLSF